MKEQALLIEKEQILGLTYPSQVSEKPADKKKELIEKCRRAMALGNLHKVKCTIFFVDVEGLKKVNTTIWGLYENYIELKGGVLINLRYIEDIFF
ncbi:MAG: hypothetical protein KG003_12575 [Bacteroidetes bacterium]|nr:hypothetical protein [Bacteroidota bacterium]